VTILKEESSGAPEWKDKDENTSYYGNVSSKTNILKTLHHFA
jgi:hypothetical protein